MEIAYHSHGTSNDDRTHAALIAIGAREGLLKGGETVCPPVLREAIEATEHRARATGYGTLSWLLKEHNVPSEQTIHFVMRIEHGHLLSGMLDVLDSLKPEARAAMRPEMVAELLRTRRVCDADSVVFVAHGLAVGYDPAAVAVFSSDGLSALRNAHRDYPSARAVLSGLGLLPGRSLARSFEPQPSGSLIAECVAVALGGEWLNEQENEPTLAAFYSRPDHRWQEAFICARFLLCRHLALTTIGAIYGDASAEALMLDLPAAWEIFKYDWAQDSDEFTRQIGVLERRAEQKLQNVDALIFGLLLDADGPEQSQIEEELASTHFAQAVVFLTRARVRFLTMLRFSLRKLSEGYRMVGLETSLGAIDIMSRGFESQHPGLWEDMKMNAPFA